MKSDLEIFHEGELFSKEEIMRSIKLTIDHIKKDKQFDKNEKERKVWLELFEKFESAVRESYLPKLRGDWWFYTHRVMFDRIDLELCKAEDVKIDADGVIDEMAMPVAEVILSVDCDYLTISEFAKLHNVSSSTVTGWINQGRLRNAWNNDKEWLVTSIQQKPSLKYESAFYTIDDSEEIEIPRFPLVSICSDIYIEQNKSDKKKFDCFFINSELDFREMMYLGSEERACLEYSLIASGKAGETFYNSPIPYITR